MRTIFSLLTAGALSASALAESGATSALTAAKLLPKGAAARLARIEAYEGAPTPERWHFLVHDPKESNGLHEYVAAGGEVVASRAVSQFAEAIKPEEVFGEAVKIDSDRVGKIAQTFAESNGLVIAAMNFVLKKDGDGAAPLWTVTCLDSAGATFGHIAVTATKGNVVSHDGFTKVPPREKLDSLAKASETPVTRGEVIAEPKRKPAVTRIRDPRVERPEPVLAQPLPPAPPQREERRGFLQRAGGSIQNIFRGRDGEERP